MLVMQFGIPRMIDFVAHYRARGLSKFQAFSLWKLASIRQPRITSHYKAEGAERINDRDVAWARGLKK